MSDTEEEEIEVKVVTVEGKKYLINPLTNDVYDATTQKKIGVYNTETDEIEEEIEVEVKRFTHEGKQYLIDESTNDIYDVETQEKIGTYNKETDEIEDEDEVEEEEDEEERKQREKEDERMTRIFKQAEEFKKRQYDEDLPMKFEVMENIKGEYKQTFLGYKTPKTNRVYTLLFAPYGMYDPKTRKVDKSKKPPFLEGYEPDEEELDAMIDDLDAEMERIFQAEEDDAES